MEQALQLTFVTDGNKSVSFTIDEPKVGLTDAEIKAAMDVMIQQGAILTTSGSLAEKKAAKLITTETREVALV